MKILKQLAKLVVPAPVKRYQANIELRLSRLEWAVDALAQGPRYDPGSNVGFNEQNGRKQIFKDVLSVGEFTNIIEAGTATGNTTGYMANTAHLPVRSCDLDTRLSNIARNKLADLPNVHLEISDSPTFLRKLAGDPGLTSANTFFYLDAHWNTYLPLREEIEIIQAHWKQFVLMVDDFAVPGDSGYRYDNYGPGKALIFDLISDLLSKHRLKAFFPTLPSAEETGARRGCLIIVRGPQIEEKIKTLTSLKEAPAS